METRQLNNHFQELLLATIDLSSWGLFGCFVSLDVIGIEIHKKLTICLAEIGSMINYMVSFIKTNY